MARPNKKAPAQPAPKSKAIAVIVVAVLVFAGVAIYFATRDRGAPEPSRRVPRRRRYAGDYVTAYLLGDGGPDADIAAALKQAASEHKRVIVDFGGDWCGDCQVLDIYFHQPPNSQLLAEHFVLVHVWIGHMDQHLDIPAKYGIPLNKGVPALAVLDASGKVVYAQTSGEFEKMREMNPTSVTEFLNTWKS